MLSKPCKWCSNTRHTSFTCPGKPRKTLKSKRGIRKIGKVGNKWIKTRELWILQNPPDHLGFYYCYIPTCGKAMTVSEMTLDHKLSRGRHPELRFDLNNLAPACAPCNTAKGSLDYDDYIQKLMGDIDGRN